MKVAIIGSGYVGLVAGTWGISDRYSWLSSYDSYKWSDGSLSRGLPFDGDLHPKKLYFEMLNSYRSAS